MLQIVLIETLWNVKAEPCTYLQLLLFGINRNIVECKGGKYAGSKWNTTVLIETLWNVKTKAEQKLIEESGINDKIKAELSEAKIKGVDKIKPDKMTLRNSLSIMDI